MAGGPPVSLSTFDPVVFDPSLVFDEMSWDLVRVKTPGDFFVEEYQPCWFRSDDALWFKNLEVSSVFVEASSGKLDVSNYLQGDPTSDDSPFWVVDRTGRAMRFDSSSPAVSGSIILLGIQGTFQVWYRSRARAARLRAGNVFARFDQQIIPLSETPLDNPWTSALKQYAGLLRGLRFSNTEVKSYLQAWALSSDPTFRIASLLGLATIEAWDATTALSVAASSVQVVHNWPVTYRYEKPVLTDEGLRTTRYIDGPVEVWWSNQLIDPSTFTVSNTGVVLQDGYLSTAQQHDLWLKYQTTTYQATGGALVAESLDGRNHFVLHTSGVAIETGSLKIDWRWDRSPENTEGTSVFT